MRGLAAAGIPVFIVRGNHDADAAALELDLPDNVTIFGTSGVERVELDADGATVALYGISYARPRVTRDLAAAYSRQGDEALAIGILHTAVGADAEGAAYAPSTLDDLRRAGMDYWALGHIHKPQVLLAGEPVAAYPGSPQGLTPNETGTHGCRVVELSAGRCVAEEIACAAFEWARLDVNVEESAGIDDVRDAVLAALDAALPKGAGLACRVTLRGSTSAHAALQRETGENLVATLRDELSSRPGPVWLDALTDLTTPPRDLEALGRDPGLAGDVARAAAALTDEPERAGALVAETTDAALRSVPGLTDEDRSTADPLELVTRARDLALDLLLREDAS